MSLLHEVSKEIRDIVENRKKELELTFFEDEHIYHMRDIDGKYRNDFPSVSKVIKKFYIPFDSETKAYQMTDGNEKEMELLLEKWKNAGDYSTNMGSRVHYMLETDLISRYGEYKEVRQPNFTCDTTQISKGNKMISAGNEFIDLMHQRGAVLLDTEMILGDPELGYVGQPDKCWLMFNKQKDGFGLVITDWKGLPIETPIFTNHGWKTMGTLTLNDKVYDKDGNLVKIKNISNIKNKKCIKLKFDNNEEIVSDFEHRWLVFTKKGNVKKEFVMTTEEIYNYHKNNRKRISHKILKIDICKPLNNEKINLPIDPYVLGVWLGDGHSADSKITQENKLVWDEISKRGYDIGEDVSQGGSGKATTRTIFNLRHLLLNLNLIKNKHIPDIYLLSSFEQRLDLLRGLMDSDGYYNKKRKRFSISTTKKNQIEFATKIITSLGLKSTTIKYNKKLNGKIIKCFNIEFTTNNFNPFLCRNQEINLKSVGLKNKRDYKNIIDVLDVVTEPTICIEVDSPSSTFLYGHTFSITHNTNQEKNFQVQPYTGKMLQPFETYHDTALSHYFVQLPLYARLLLKMLKGSKYENLKLLGCVVVHLKDNGTFVEYKVPSDVTNTILTIDIKKYLK
jgi:hypothetical protein